jgi:threonine dehydratase
MIIIEEHNGINVLRDDYLTGGTKSILMPSIIGDDSEYVYASPVYGGFQIALSAYCGANNKKATIFCAKRKTKHSNTLICEKYGANIIEVNCGYLSVVEKRARDYCEINKAIKLNFGANTKNNIKLIANRMREIISKLKREPSEIWCAVGSGTLLEGILEGTEKSIINGVIVGKDYENTDNRVKLYKYHKKFEQVSKFVAGFNSMPNYDLKAFEYCVKYKSSNDVLFWNVL